MWISRQEKKKLNGKASIQNMPERIFSYCMDEHDVYAFHSFIQFSSISHSTIQNSGWSYQISLSAFVWNSPRWSVGKISFWAKREREREKKIDFQLISYHHVHLDARGAWRTPVGNDTIWIIEYFFKLNQLRIIALSRAWRYARDRLLYSRAIWIILMHFLGNFFFRFLFRSPGSDVAEEKKFSWKWNGNLHTHAGRRRTSREPRPR